MTAEERFMDITAMHHSGLSLWDFPALRAFTDRRDETYRKQVISTVPSCLL